MGAKDIDWRQPKQVARNPRINATDDLVQDDKDYPQPNRGDRGGRSEILTVQPKPRRQARGKNDGFHR